MAQKHKRVQFPGVKTEGMGMCRRLEGGTSGGVSSGQIVERFSAKPGNWNFFLEAIESLPRLIGPSFCSKNENIEIG